MIPKHFSLLTSHTLAMRMICCCLCISSRVRSTELRQIYLQFTRSTSALFDNKATRSWHFQDYVHDTSIHFTRRTICYTKTTVQQCGILKLQCQRTCPLCYTSRSQQPRSSPLQAYIVRQAKDSRFSSCALQLSRCTCSVFTESG